MMTEPTPTPWNAATKYSSIVGVPIVSRTGQRIGNTALPDYPPEWEDLKRVAEANAAFIVKAVNAHTALVKALEQALRQWKMYAEMTEQGEFDIETDVSFEGDAFRECRAILTSIKES